MKSNALKLVYAALFGTALIIAPGCSGTDGSDDRVLRQVLGLVQNLLDQLINTLEQLTGIDLSGLKNTLDDLLNGKNGSLGNLLNIGNSGQVNGLLGLGGSNSNQVNGLVGTLTNVVNSLTGVTLLGGNNNNGGGVLGLSVPAVDQAVTNQQQSSANPTAADVLEKAQALKLALKQGLPGGFAQMTDGMRTLGASVVNLSNQVVGTDDRSQTVRTLLVGMAGLLTANANSADAVADLDGAAYTNAEHAALDAIQTMANNLPNHLTGALLTELVTTRNSLDSTRLPIIRATMDALKRTQAGTQFNSVMAGVTTGNLDNFGGKGGLQRLLDTPANTSTGSPLGNLQTGLGNLGNLTGPLAGLNQGGLPAVNDILDPDQQLPSFGTLIPQIPGFASASPGQVGNLISTVLTPGAGGILPINSLANAGLLSGNVLGNLGQIGSILSGLGATGTP